MPKLLRTCLIAVAGTLGWVSAGLQASGTEPLKVKMTLPQGPYFVGQAIEIKVEVEGQGQGEGKDASPLFEAPKSSTWSIRSKSIDPSHPATGRFVLITKRSGPLEIPSFRARSGDRSGSTRPTRLTILNVPVEGRGPAFLGGVGGFEVKAAADPTSLRAGQVFEYRIQMTGSAAWGSDRSPDLTAWASLGAGVRVEALPDLLDGVDPPSRTFRYRIRPKGQGRLVLPPVAVAAFDPTTRRFATRMTSGLPILIEKPPTLDPKSLKYEPIGPLGNVRSGPGAVGIGLGLLIGIGLSVSSGWWIVRKRRRPKSVDPARLALELARTLDNPPEVDPAQRVIEALTTYLEQVGQRPTGVLTPPEALEGFGRLTTGRELGEPAQRLMIACDRARYRDRASGSIRLVEEGRAFFEVVAEAMRRKPGEKKPREAVETG